MKRNRIIGTTVVVFASLFTFSALLAPAPENLSRLNVSVASADSTRVNVPVGVVEAGITAPVSASEAKLEETLPSQKTPAFELASLDDSTSEQSVATNNVQIEIPTPEPVAKQAKKPTKQAQKSTQKKDDDELLPVPHVTSTGMIPLASLTHKESATSLASRLKKDKFPVSVKDVIVDKKQYTRVVLGPYTSKKASNQAIERLAKLGYTK